MRKIIKSITVIFFIFFLGVLYFSLNRSSDYNTEYLIGNKIEKIKLESFRDDKIFTTEDFKNNIHTLINFWASWCAPCRIEHPFLMELSNEKNIQILGVNFKDKKNNALKFLRDLGDPYDDLAIDYDGKQSVNFGIYGIPESILLNKDLKIMKKFIGPLNSENVLEIIKVIQ